jgi:transcriptional regulator with XRE-family HTH domain
MTGPDLRAARKQLGYTRAELADALDLVQETIADYETGKRPIPRTVELAMQALDRSP